MIGVEQHLGSSEQILVHLKGTYETTFGGKKLLRKGYLVATDKRLVFYGKKLFGYHMESIMYPKVASIEHSRSMMGPYVTVYTSGNVAELKWISGGNIQEFMDKVLTKIE